MNRLTASRLEGAHHLICPENQEHLRDKHLVTEVMTCPAYALYLSNKSKFLFNLPAKHHLIAIAIDKETVRFALHAKTPAAAAGVVLMEWGWEVFKSRKGGEREAESRRTGI